MNIKKILWGLNSRLFERINYFEEVSICEYKLKAGKGTVRNKVDLDDIRYFYLAKNNDIIFDVGANITSTGLLAMIQNPNRRYILIDPNPKALLVASKNMIMNSHENNSSFFSAFVSDKIGDKIKL